MLLDLAINPFDASVRDMVALAVDAESRGIGCVWVADHFSGAIADRSWSRDPFVCLGAIAAATDRVDVGVLVANVVNRHPAQLASAANSLQSLAPGRVRLGVGSGAAPGSRFAVEHEAIGTVLADVAVRRRRLAASVAALRAIWDGRPEFDADQDGTDEDGADENGVEIGNGVGFSGLSAVVDDAPCPPLIVGASSWPTIEVALAVADGVNLRRTGALDGHLDRIRDQRPEGFEVSVLDWFDDVADERNRIDRYARSGVDRLVLGISPPHATQRLDRLDLGPR